MADEFRQAEEGELEAVYALRGRAFARGNPERNRAPWFASHDRNDPWRAAGANYVATCSGQIVATVRIFARRMWMGTEELAVAAFSAVATDPSYQRRGYMRRLLAFVNEQNAARGFALGFLSTSSQEVYQGAGFRTLAVPWYTLDLPPSRGTVSHAGSVAPTMMGDGRWSVAPPATGRREAMRAVYDAFGRGRPGYPVRDEAFWSHPSHVLQHEPAAWLRLAVDGDGIVGAYLLAAQGHWSAQGVAILECPYAPGAETAAHLLIAALAMDPICKGRQVADGALPCDHTLFAPDAPLPGRDVTVDYLMLRPYTARGAQAEETLRREAEHRFIYWIADYV